MARWKLVYDVARWKLVYDVARWKLVYDVAMYLWLVMCFNPMTLLHKNIVFHAFIHWLKKYCNSKMNETPLLEQIGLFPS